LHCAAEAQPDASRPPHPRFTELAVLMTHFALPQPLLLGTGAEVEHALGRKKICIFAQEKYRMCVERGLVDFNSTGFKWRGSR
jgi:hypothetical protein